MKKALALPLTLLLLASTPVLAEDPVRKAELARIEKEVQAQKKEAEENAADLLPQQKALKEKVAQKEKALQDLARRRRVTGPTAKSLEKLQEELGELDEQIKDRKGPHLDRLAELEQERRRVVKRFPEPGDPAYVEVGGKLYTQEEWDLEKTRSPRGVAEEYIQELLRRGIIRSAKYTETTRDTLPLEPHLRRGLTVRDFRNVNYVVQYVSKGGVLNERGAWVTVLTVDGEHWAVDRGMIELEVLGGLP